MVRAKEGGVGVDRVGKQKDELTHLVRVPTCEVDGDGAAEGEAIQDDASVFEAIIIEDEVERGLRVYSKACAR